MSKKLTELERKMTDGFGKITTREGMIYFMQYVREAIRIITKKTKKSEVERALFQEQKKSSGRAR
jgi:hypothetical protein